MKNKKYINIFIIFALILNGFSLLTFVSKNKLNNFNKYSQLTEIFGDSKALICAENTEDKYTYISWLEIEKQHQKKLAENEKSKLNNFSDNFKEFTNNENYFSLHNSLYKYFSFYSLTSSSSKIFIGYQSLAPPYCS